MNATPKAKKVTPHKILEQFKLPPDICRWLESTKEKTSLTKTAIVERALRNVMAKKSL